MPKLLHYIYVFKNFFAVETTEMHIFITFWIFFIVTLGHTGPLHTTASTAAAVATTAATMSL